MEHCCTTVVSYAGHFSGLRVVDYGRLFSLRVSSLRVRHIEGVFLRGL